MAECGTPSMYTQHYKNGKKPCDACREAFSEYQKGRYEKRKRDGGVLRQYNPVSRRVLDILQTDGGWMSLEAIVADFEARFGDVRDDSMRRAVSGLIDRDKVVRRDVPSGWSETGYVARVEYEAT